MPDPSPTPAVEGLYPDFPFAVIATCPACLGNPPSIEFWADPDSVEHAATCRWEGDMQMVRVKIVAARGGADEVSSED